MTSVDEALDANTELAADLAAGVTTLDLNQTVTFTQYVKVVLPLDGFVFWVRADILSPGALYNAARYNSKTYGKASTITPAPTKVARGSLHIATSQQQGEDATIAVNQIVFTSLDEIDFLNEIGPMQMWVAAYQPTDGEAIRFAFAGRRFFYRQASLYHYFGNAVYSTLGNILVDSPADLVTVQPVVSNSLPVWLGLNQWAPPVKNAGLLATGVLLYPSFLVPDNLPPPYGVVHIPEDSTTALQMAPLIGPTGSHDQLVKDTVNVTLYGLRNSDALAFQDAVLQYSLATDVIGIMNNPIIRDSKKFQVELSALAMRKTIIFEVSYYQSAVRTLARNLIRHCVPAFEIAA